MNHTRPPMLVAGMAFLGALALSSCDGPPTAGETPETDEGHSEEGAARTPPPPVDPASLPEVRAMLGVPPAAAPPVDRDGPARVVVEIEVQEVTREIADGVEYTFWTFGGTVPGPMVRVRRGDWVELHLQNHPNNTMPHNIDLHAVTGPGGGATSTFTAPGHQTQFSFQALNTGVYVYHCATAPVGMHVANGMYGLIVVEPEDGYPAVDREYYVMQGDFYTPGDYREPGLQPFDMQRAIAEDPSYVVFNGRDGSLVGDRALTAEVGQSVRFFVGNGGPNLVSSFHVIGEIFDTVYPEGGMPGVHDVQTTLVPAGGASIVDFTLQVPGTFILVDHSIFRAFNKGALGMLRVTGEEQPAIYSGLEVDEAYLGDQAPAATAVLAEAGDAEGLAARMSRGQATFIGICSTCHQREGQGLGSVFPPLASSDFLMADEERSIRLVIQGLTGPIQVNGAEFNGVMPPFANLTDHEIADVLTYVRGSFGNEGSPITDEAVARVRASIPPPDTAGHP